jgi:small subunit ribosomal protein S15
LEKGKTFSRLGKQIMLDKKKKQRIIAKFRVHKNDTGSPQVQIAILSEEIKGLANHLKNHKHDHSSRRGLLKKVNERRKLLKYLQKEDEKAFKTLTKDLNLKIAKKMQNDEDEKRRIEEEILKKQEEKIKAQEEEEKKQEEKEKSEEDLDNN